MAQRRDGVRLTWRGRGVLVSALLGLIVAYARDIDALVVLSVLLAAAVAAALLSARHRRPSLAVHRAFAAESPAPSHPVPVMLDVANRSLRPVGAATWSDEWAWVPRHGFAPRSIRGASTPAELPVLRGRTGDVQARVRVEWEFVPPRRGHFAVGPLRLQVGDPFGLAAATTTVGEPTSITVYPPLVDLGVGSSTPRRSDGVARRADHRATGSEHELTTRTYRAGDPIGRVHWRASARHGELMVRQEEHRDAAEVTVLLETRRSHYSDTDRAGTESATFERAVSLGASLAVHFDAAGFRVHVLETGAPQLPGDGLSLEGLAHLGLTAYGRHTGVSLVPSGRRGAARLGSAFAVLARVDEATAADLAAARGLYEEAVAWVGDDTAESAIEVLAASGWACVPVGSALDVAAAWDAAQGARADRGAA